jgi:succinoglycan biosynthesis transport protein ExoP
MIDDEELKTGSSTSFTTKQAIAAVRKHTHSIVPLSLFLMAAGIVAVSLFPNIYRASTTILLDPQKIPERYVASTITADMNARLSTLTQQVLSASRLQEIIDKYNLYPKLRKRASREEVIDYMRSRTKIDIKASPESIQSLSSFSITYESEDRDLVAKVTNQLAASFILWNLKAREQQAMGTTQFLSSELEQAKNSLEEQERALEAYRMQHAGATPDALTGNLQALSRLQTENESNDDSISRLDQERILLTQVKSTDPREAPLTERDRLVQERRRLEGELSNLKRQFTDSYPDVISVKEHLEDINTRLAEMPESSASALESMDTNTRVRLGLIEKELQRHKDLKASLQRQITAFQAKVDSVPVLETRLAELTRNYEVSRQNYQSLLDKTLSAGMSEQLEQKQQAQRFTILDSAKTPERPVKPKRIPLFAGIVAVALLLPVATAIAREFLRGTIQSESDLKQMLPPKIILLGTIPPIRSKADLRRARRLTIQTSLLVGLACSAIVLFLLKVKPVL